MVDNAELAERLRKLEESHNLLARRVNELDSTKGALKAARRVENVEVLIGLPLFIGFIVWLFWSFG